jgi:hypothetical protein
VALIFVMKAQSKGPRPFPMKAAIPAGMTLMLHGLDFIDKAKITKIAEPELDRATQIFTNELFHRSGITPQMLQQLSAKVTGIANDPVAMAKIDLKAGITQHPMAAKPTPMPDEAPPQ